MKKIAIISALLLIALSISACKKEDKPSLNDGTYDGISMGFYNTDVTATVVIEKGKITSVKIDTSGETADIGEPVGEKIAKAVLAKGSTEGVEKIAQATVSSTAAIEAVDKAIAQAK